MLWQPSRKTAVTRKIETSNSLTNEQRKMPSWLWLRWQGSFNFGAWDASSSGRMQIRSLAKWEKFKTGKEPCSWIGYVKVQVNR